MLKNANFLILDEPTNHLDILSKEKLEDILLLYPGTVLFVSHDRYFVKKIADSILEFSSEEIHYYDYCYEDYLEKEKALVEQQDLPVPIKKEKKQKERVNGVSLDKQIGKLEKEIEELKQELFLESVYTNPEKYQEITEKIEILEEKLNHLLAQWE